MVIVSPQHANHSIVRLLCRTQVHRLDECSNKVAVFIFAGHLCSRDALFALVCRFLVHSSTIMSRTITHTGPTKFS